MMITNSINRSIAQIDSLLDGWTFGRLVVELNAISLQQEDSNIIPVPVGATLEVKNGDQWQCLSARDLAIVITEGWPAYAGLEARMRMP